MDAPRRFSIQVNCPKCGRCHGNIGGSIEREGRTYDDKDLEAGIACACGTRIVFLRQQPSQWQWLLWRRMLLTVLADFRRRRVLQARRAALHQPRWLRRLQVRPRSH